MIESNGTYLLSLNQLRGPDTLVPPAQHFEFRRRSDDVPPGQDLASLVDQSTQRVHLAYGLHCLNAVELRNNHREIQRSLRAGTNCRPDEYWERTAFPRSQAFVDLMTGVIDIEFRQLSAAISTQCLHPLDKEQVSQMLSKVTPCRTELDQLGEWWLRRLRRAAWIAAVPALVTSIPSAASFALARAEMLLLDTAPWGHGDRLLSAFELAHTKISQHAKTQRDSLIGY